MSEPPLLLTVALLPPVEPESPELPELPEVAEFELVAAPPLPELPPLPAVDFAEVSPPEDAESDLAEPPELPCQLPRSSRTLPDLAVLCPDADALALPPLPAAPEFPDVTQTVLPSEP